MIMHYGRSCGFLGMIGIPFSGVRFLWSVGLLLDRSGLHAEGYWQESWPVSSQQGFALKIFASLRERKSGGEVKGKFISMTENLIIRGVTSTGITPGSWRILENRGVRLAAGAW